MCTLKMCAIKIVTIDMVPFFASYQIQREQLHRQRSSEKTALRMEGTREQGDGAASFRSILGHVYSQTEMNPPCTSLALTPSVEVSQLCQV